MYGSFVPLRYQPLEWSQAIERFARVPYLDIGVHWRADFVANLLLFVPLGYFWLAVVDTDRPRRLAAVVATPVIALLLGLLIVAIEFTQLWFPPRTVSRNDMLAESVGACVGLALWFGVGRRGTHWLRRFFGQTTTAADWRIKLLLLYGVGLLVYEMLPLDLVVSPEEIRRKIEEGRVVLVPFSAGYRDLFEGLWQVVMDMALFVPIGVFMRVGWMPPGQIRSISPAVTMAVVLAAGFEMVQLFVFTRHVDTTDILTRGLGGLIGACLAVPLWRRLEATPLTTPPPGASVVTDGTSTGWSHHDANDLVRRRALTLLACVLYALPVAAAFLYPFRWVTDGAEFRENLRFLLDYPFKHYYWGQEFNSATNLLRGVMLFVPLGAIWRWGMNPSGESRPPRWLWLAAAVLAIGLTIESGQAMTIDGTADVTDIMMYLAGATGGWLIVGRLRQPHEPDTNHPGHSRG